MRASGALAREADEGLIRRAVDGDAQAFHELYRRHVDLVWRRLGRLIGPDPEREDLVQQIFLDVYRGLDRFRAEASFRTFLHRVVVNTAYDHLKRRRRRPAALAAEDLELLIAPEASPEARIAGRQRLALTWSLLDRIKPKKRIAFLLRVVEGLSLEEIAVMVEASAAAVAQRVRHAQTELDGLMARQTLRGETR